MCINKKVLIGLGAVAAGILLVKPAWFVAALPLLILALCPLSMVFMMRGMNNNSQGKGQAGSSCGMGGKTRKTTSSAAGTKLDEQISALQAELRDLKATQARREGTTAAKAEQAINFTKDSGPDARA